MIEGDRSDDAAAVAIGGREAALLDGTLRETISLPNGQTPTDLMFTPNWPDQNPGIGRCGQRSASRLTMLCAATAAPRTALSQCSSVRNWYWYST